MGRRVIVLLVVAAVCSASAASFAQAGPRDATAAATKCKAKNKKKCKKKTAAPAIKDGDYTYKQASAGAAPVNTLTISGKGTKIRIREQYFSSGEDPAGLSCAATMIEFGTLKLTKSGDFLMWSSGATKITVPPIQTQGAGGGTATTSGEINIKTLVVNVNTDVVMKNRSGQSGSGCHEGHRYEGVQKLKRK